jgi:hypothetical protein
VTEPHLKVRPNAPENQFVVPLLYLPAVENHFFRPILSQRSQPPNNTPRKRKMGKKNNVAVAFFDTLRHISMRKKEEKFSITEKKETEREGIV